MSWTIIWDLAISFSPSSDSMISRSASDLPRMMSIPFEPSSANITSGWLHLPSAACLPQNVMASMNTSNALPSRPAMAAPHVVTSAASLAMAFPLSIFTACRTALSLRRRSGRRSGRARASRSAQDHLPLLVLEPEPLVDPGAVLGGVQDDLLDPLLLAPREDPLGEERGQAVPPMLRQRVHVQHVGLPAQEVSSIRRLPA